MGPFTLLLDCTIHTEREREEFVMKIDAFPFRPLAGDTVATYSTEYRTPIDVEITERHADVHHGVDGTAATTYVRLQAHLEDPLEAWTIRGIKDAFASTGWKILPKEVAAERFPFFLFR